MIAPHRDLVNHGSTVSGKVLTENPHRKHASQRDKSHGDREDHQPIEPAEAYAEASTAVLIIV
jgi:hypothetical protein